MNLIITIVFFSLAGILVIFFSINYILQKVYYLPHIPNSKTPKEYGINFIEYFIKNGSDKKVQLWDLNPTKEGHIVLVVHGWSKAVDSLLPVSNTLVKQARVFMLNTRNHGDSDNDYEFSMKKFKEDVLCALNYIRNDLMLSENIILLGHSFGAAAVLEIAKVSADINGLVLLSVFPDGESLMRHQFRQKKLPGILIDSLISFIEFKNDEKLSRVAPEKVIEHINIPILLLHGGQDEFITIENFNSLKKKLNKHSTAVLIQDACHQTILENQILINEIELYISEFSETIKRYNNSKL